jgi:hypothetical protein
LYNILRETTFCVWRLESWLIVYFKKEKHGELGDSWHKLYSMHLPVKRTWFFCLLPLTKFKYFFTGIYLCCSNIYNIFIKYIVLYDEIHLKYCRDTVAYGSIEYLLQQWKNKLRENARGKAWRIGGQLTSTVQHAFAGKTHVTFLSCTSAR